MIPVELSQVLLAMHDDLMLAFPEHEADVLRDKKRVKSLMSRGEYASFASEYLPEVHVNFLDALEGRSVYNREEKYLRWLTDLVWEAPCSPIACRALRAHRQMCHVIYKYQAPYSPEKEAKVLDNFKTLEVNDLAKIETAIEQQNNFGLRSILSRCRYYLREVAPEALFELKMPSPPLLLRDKGLINPKHGPGAVATGERGIEKWQFKRLYNSLHQRFPYYEYFVVGGSSHLLDRCQWYRGLQRIETPTAKVVLVPKDSRGPRLISEEPLELQYMQQGYLRWMMSWTKHPWLLDHVSFTNQEINGSLALCNSLSREYATLDLKDASDRVTCALVKAIFPVEMANDLMALRSSHTTLPTGETIPLRKFAPMGSGICFTTLALTVWSVCVAALEQCDDELARKPWKHVYVFGDDVIVPTRAVPWVKHALKLVGLCVNERKSFAGSYFRESCGVDAYLGTDITPTRIKTQWSHRSTDGPTYVAYLSYVNSFRRKGWLRTADQLQHFLELLHGELPRTMSEQDYPGVEIDVRSGLNVPLRWNSALCLLQAHVRVFTPFLSKSQPEGWNRLLRDLLSDLRSGPPTVAPLSNRGTLKRRWMSIRH